MEAHVEGACKYYTERATGFLNRNERMTKRDMSWAVRANACDDQSNRSFTRLALLDKALRSMDVERSEMQIRFHQAFTQASLRFICRDDKDADIQKIMAARGWDNIKQQVLCLTPRRFGKTYAVAMFAAAIIAIIPGSEQGDIFDRSSCVSEDAGDDSDVRCDTEEEFEYHGSEINKV